MRPTMPARITGNLVPTEIRENPDVAERIDQLDALENQAFEERLALVRQVFKEEGGLEGKRGASYRTAMKLRRRPQYVDSLLKSHGATAPKKDQPRA